MKIAFTGASSTGKTTLAKALFNDRVIRRVLCEHLSVDARTILNDMGHKSMDKMSKSQLQKFQLLYLDRKLILEKDKENFLVERSFVDIAAYWIERDSTEAPNNTTELLIKECKNQSKKYDLHVYFPFGVIDFEEDGYRSLDMESHFNIDARIIKLLNQWKLQPVLTLNYPELSKRVSTVAEWVKSHNK
jgi:nicotinamide riboside kinase